MWNKYVDVITFAKLNCFRPQPIFRWQIRSFTFYHLINAITNLERRYKQCLNINMNKVRNIYNGFPVTAVAL